MLYFSLFFFWCLARYLNALTWEKKGGGGGGWKKEEANEKDMQETQAWAETKKKDDGVDIQEKSRHASLLRVVWVMRSPSSMLTEACSERAGHSTGVALSIAENKKKAEGQKRTEAWLTTTCILTKGGVEE